MPFRSKAQQRWMFATNPTKAKEWAKETKDIKALPDKLHPQKNPQRKNIPAMKDKTASEGRFFEKRSQHADGKFFADGAGRDDGRFYEKTAMGMATPPMGGGMNVSPMMGTGKGAKGPQPTKDLNIGATGGPTGGTGYRGEGMSGGMYGTGAGATKKAAAKPSDGDAIAGGTGIPTGFHRPAGEQPEGLEAGGTRFHSTEVNSPHQGTGHGVIEAGRLRMGKGRTHSMGKHAHMLMLKEAGVKDDFVSSLGQSANYLKDRGRETYESARKGVTAAGRKADALVREGAKSPAASTAAAALGLYGMYRGLRRGGRGLRNLVRGKQAPPPGRLQRAGQALKDIISGK